MEIRRAKGPAARTRTRGVEADRGTSSDPPSDGGPVTVPGRGVALWRQIADAIEADIRARRYPPGGRLPTEGELAARFGVNRHTLRRAVAALQDAGLLRIEQGRGTFVQEDVIDYPLSRRTRFSEIVHAQARTPSGELLRTARIPADKVMATALGLSPGDPVALIETLGMVDGRPISIASHHFSLQCFPDVFRAFEATGTITAMLTRLGAGDYVRKETRVTARMPDAFEMHHLKLPKTVPVMVVESVNVDAAGAPIEFGISRFAATRVQIVFRT